MSVAASLRRLAVQAPAGLGTSLLHKGLEPACAGALQSRLLAAVHQCNVSGWLRARGFASSSGGAGDGGGGAGSNTSGKHTQRGEQQGGPEQQQEQHNAAPAARSEQPPQQLEQHQAPAAEQPAAAAAASSSSGGAGSEEPPSFGEVHPELKKYIDQLKQLKGSTTVQRQEVGSKPTMWQHVMQATVGNWLQTFVSNFIRAKVEKEFEPEEFLEGAKDAFWTVHELLADDNWEGLKPLMSAKLYAAFKDTADTYKADGLVWRTTLGSEALETSIRGLGFMNKQEMEGFDPALASLAPDSVSMAVAPTGMFLVVSVQLRWEQNVTITRFEDGLVVAELRDLRPVRWKFATGPLPGDLPVDQLGSQWFLLSI